MPNTARAPALSFLPDLLLRAQDIRLVIFDADGDRGAARELCDLILVAQDDYAQYLRK